MENEPPFQGGRYNRLPINNSKGNNKGDKPARMRASPNRKKNNGTCKKQDYTGIALGQHV
jgi:hypothetical protein